MSGGGAFLPPGLDMGHMLSETWKLQGLLTQGKIYL